MSAFQEQNNESFSKDSEEKTFSFPTSFAQQRLWFLDRLIDESGLYNIHWSIGLKGALDISAMQKSFQAIVDRHEVLRTFFKEQEGELVQVIKESIAFQCEQIDLSTVTQNNQDNETQRLLEIEAKKPFNLKKAPLIRALLLKVSDQEHILSITIHHIIADGQSKIIFQQELAGFYSAFHLGETVTFPELPIQYADYTMWQREQLQGEVLAKQIKYWKDQLACLTTLEIPTDHPRPKQLSYQGKKANLQLSMQLTEDLKNMSKLHGVTLFMTLLAAFQLLLHRYSGQDDIVVGSPIAGRNQQEIEPLIGFFVNTIALRNDLSGNPGFIELLHRVRKTCLDAYTHQDIPFEKLVTELNPQRDLSRQPFVQVMLVLQHKDDNKLTFPGLKISPITVVNKTAKFDLALSFKENQDGLQGIVEYSTDLFDAPTIVRLIDHLQTLLQSIVDCPATTIAELPLLTEQERHQQLVEWNTTATDYPKNKCVQHLFEKQAASTPNAVALVFDEQQLRYQELNMQANQLAHYLQTKGIANGSFVGLCMDRCIDLVVGLLAILKAGGAYVPLDPAYPKERLSYMMEDTQVAVVLTHQKLSASLPEEKGVKEVIVIDGAEAAIIKQQPSDNLNLEVSAKQPAYLIFTSGSTGKPKGVIIPHYAINRLVINSDYLKLLPVDRVAHVSNVSFDAATFEIWGALLTGACLVIIPKSQLLSLSEFGQTLNSQSITTLFLTTALLNQLIDTTPECLATIDNLLFGGEAVDANRIRQLLTHKSPKRLLHVYGPTESTTFATWYEIKTVNENATTIPIGRPLANTTAYILDKQLQPQPIGITGELYIGGDGVALAYHQRPELNKERFLCNPFNQQEKLYKTGDFVRYLADGNIEFLGRVDDQIKLRGFRIELGEIESILHQHALINDALITITKDPAGDKKLLAYIIGTQNQSPTVHELRNYLKQKLPDYMVPALFIFLHQFPLTENGKIDRHALPLPDKAISEKTSTYIAPRSPREEILIAIWQEILNIDQISIDDNFFEIGGHSLLAIRLITKIKNQLDKTLPIEVIFQCPTVRQLSKVLQNDGNTQNNHLNPIITPVKKGGGQKPFFWLHGATIVPLISEYLDIDRPFYFLNHQSLDGKKAKYGTIPEIARYYCQVILQVDSKGPYYLGGYSVGGMVMYEIARQLCEQGKIVAILFLLDPTKIKTDSEKKAIAAKQNFSISDEYHKFNKLGYLCYLRSISHSLKKTCQDKFDSYIIQACFFLGIPLPEKLIWPYLFQLYIRAGNRYQPQNISQGIEKAALIQIKNSTYSNVWENVFNNNVDVHYLDTTHLRLKEKPDALSWIDILARMIP